MTAGGVPRQGRVRGSETYPIRKAKPGGWSQPRYQHAAEQAWQRNAGDVAAAAVDLAEQIGAEVLVVAGDVRAVQLLLDQLPERWLARVVRLNGGSRATGADPEPLDDVTVQAIADVAARHTDGTLDRYRAQCLRGGAAGSGLAAVVAALQRSQADTVAELVLVGADDPPLAGGLGVLLRYADASTHR